MVASSPFYISGTFWGVVAALAALALIPVTIILWHAGAPRRVLSYSAPIMTPLIRVPRPPLGGKSLQVLLDGKPLKEPYVVVLRLDNKGRRDIRTGYFEQEEPLEFDFGTEVLTVSPEPKPQLARLAQSIKSDGTKISLGPARIPGRSRVQVAVVTDGRPSITCQSSLANIIVREQGSEKQRRRYGVADLVATILLFASLITVTILMDAHVRGAIIGVLLAVAVTALVVEIWIRVKTSPPR